MAKPNIKFFRCNPWPSTVTPQEGYVWFNTTDRTISLYKNGSWEKYSGKINDVSYNENTGTLTITSHDGVATTVPLGDVKNIADLTNRLSTLETSFSTLSGEFTTEKGKIATLQGEMTTVKTEVAKLEGITDKVTTYVVTKIGEEEKVRKAADDAFEGRISGLETTTGQHTSDINGLKDLVGTTAVATQITNAINALDNNGVTGEGTFVDVTVTQVDGKVTGVSVTESNIASTSALNTVDQKVDGEITRATNKENELAGAIDTQKGRIDTLVGTGTGSVRDIAIDVLAEHLVKEGASEAFDTLQEVSAWIKNHPEEAAAMNAAIGENTTAISGLTGRVGALESVKDAYKAADETTLASAKSYADGKAATAESNAKAYTDELAEVVDDNTTNIATNTGDIATIKDQITEINTAIEENELTVASALTDLDSRLTTLSSKAVTSAEGSNYATASVADGKVTVSTVTGSVASGSDALATASDVKAYVDSMWTWGEY